MTHFKDAVFATVKSFCKPTTHVERVSGVAAAFTSEEFSDKLGKNLKGVTETGYIPPLLAASQTPESFLKQLEMFQTNGGITRDADGKYRISAEAIKAEAQLLTRTPG